MTTALDTNVLVDLAVSSAEHHLVVTNFVNAYDDDLATTQTNAGEFLRLITHPRVFRKPAKLRVAVTTLEDILSQFGILLLPEESEWWKDLIGINEVIPGLSGNEIFDARIALCLKANGIKKILTRDADFKKYDFLSPMIPR